MESRMLQNRLNKILEEKKFNSNVKDVSILLNKETGIFIGQYFLVVEVENVQNDVMKGMLEQVKKSSVFAHIENDDESVKYVTLNLWIIDLNGGQFLQENDSKVCRKVPIQFFARDIFSVNHLTNSSVKGDNTDSKSVKNDKNTPGHTNGNVNQILCMTEKKGEQSVQVTNSSIDEFQIAIYTEKQVFVGHVENLLKNETLDNRKFEMHRVSMLLLKSVPSIISLKFHKLSPHHLAILTDDQYFTIYNLQASLSYQELQFNLAKLPRYGGGTQNEFFIQENTPIHFVDFEFGGSSDFSLLQERKNPKHNIIDDFDFLSVYFLTNDGYIYYQSPLVLKDMRLDRDLVQQLRSYLLSEIELVTDFEQNQDKKNAYTHYIYTTIIQKEGQCYNNIQFFIINLRNKIFQIMNKYE